MSMILLNKKSEAQKKKIELLGPFSQHQLSLFHVLSIHIEIIK